MKIFTNKQYKELLAETRMDEREKVWDRDRVDRSFNDLNNQIWDLSKRVSKLEGVETDSNTGMIKPI